MDKAYDSVRRIWMKFWRIPIAGRVISDLIKKNRAFPAWIVVLYYQLSCYFQRKPSSWIILRNIRQNPLGLKTMMESIFEHWGLGDMVTLKELGEI